MTPKALLFKISECKLIVSNQLFCFMTTLRYKNSSKINSLKIKRMDENENKTTA